MHFISQYENDKKKKEEKGTYNQMDYKTLDHCVVQLEKDISTQVVVEGILIEIKPQVVKHVDEPSGHKNKCY